MIFNRFLFAFVMIFYGGFMNGSKNTITDYFDNSTNIVVFADEQKHLYFKGDDKFEIILKQLEDVCKDAHDMPAFGVSIHNETVEAKKHGLWLELEFATEQTFNEMPFNCLLINIVPEASGFNLIRKTNGKYDGRCFYLNLNSKTKNLFYCIQEIIKYII